MVDDWEMEVVLPHWMPLLRQHSPGGLDCRLIPPRRSIRALYQVLALSEEWNASNVCRFQERVVIIPEGDIIGDIRNVLECPNNLVTDPCFLVAWEFVKWNEENLVRSLRQESGVFPEDDHPPPPISVLLDGPKSEPGLPIMVPGLRTKRKEDVDVTVQNSEITFCFALM